MDLSNIINFRNGVYWLSLDIVFAVVVAWVLLNLFSCLQIQGVVWLIREAAYYSLPLLGTVSFVPILTSY